MMLREKFSTRIVLIICLVNISENTKIKLGQILTDCFWVEDLSVRVFSFFVLFLFPEENV